MLSEIPILKYKSGDDSFISRGGRINFVDPEKRALQKNHAPLVRNGFFFFSFRKGSKLHALGKEIGQD
jgi:hypothetical protein